MMIENNPNLSPRAFTIEMSVNFEHLLNVIIAQLLGVKNEDTKSFGNSSQALSFNTKANLLLDLNYLNKEQRVKFQIFIEIRNKFAHLHSVDTYEKCFEQTNNYSQLKKLFRIDEEGDSLEKDMEYMFIVLSLEIAMILKKINEKIISEMAIKYTQRRFTEAIKIKRKEYNSQYPENAKAIDDFIKFIKDDLIIEVDKKVKDKVPPHV